MNLDINEHRFSTTYHIPTLVFCLPSSKSVFHFHVGRTTNTLPIPETKVKVQCHAKVQTLYNFNIFNGNVISHTQMVTQD
ncbi:hypothetical protein HanPI659440_Chr05g0186131 [Helianthus annuus]|nr:hypothetical protein HanPI659440_Chr05g0186131 [Helianthus annuus]